MVSKSRRSHWPKTNTYSHPLFSPTTVYNYFSILFSPTTAPLSSESPPSYDQLFGVRRMRQQVKEARDTSSNKGSFAVKFCDIVCSSGTCVHNICTTKPLSYILWKWVCKQWNLSQWSQWNQQIFRQLTASCRSLCTGLGPGVAVIVERWLLWPL